MPPRKGRPAKAGAAKSAPPREPGPARVLLAADVRLGGVPEGLPELPDRLAAVAAGASRAAFEALVERAAKGADAVILTGRLLDDAADVRAEAALRAGLDRLAGAGVPAFAVTGETLPEGWPLTVLAPDEPAELEIARGGEPLAALRVIAGEAEFPFPDGLPVLGVLLTPEAEAAGCDVIVPPDGPRRTVRSERAVTHRPGPLHAHGVASLVTLPAAAGGGGAEVKAVSVGPVRFAAGSADLLDEPADLAAELRDRLKNEPPPKGVRLRIVDWTLRVGRWGDGLAAGRRAAALRQSLDDRDGSPATLHRFTVVPHPDRFAADEGATFLETLSHFDPLGESDALPPALADVPADPARVAALASRYALPLIDFD